MKKEVINDSDASIYTLSSFNEVEKQQTENQQLLKFIFLDFYKKIIQFHPFLIWFILYLCFNELFNTQG